MNLSAHILLVFGLHESNVARANDKMRASVFSRDCFPPEKIQESAEKDR